MNPRHATRRTLASRPMAIVTIGALSLVVGVIVSVLARDPAPGSQPREPAAPVAAAPLTVHEPVVEAAAVLRAWDARRARAWATGSVRDLRRLYAGRAGARDVRLLRAYTRRGLHVRGLRMQLLAVQVLSSDPQHLTLRVTDRVAHAVAVGEGRALPLPRDQSSVRDLDLVRVGGRWRVAAVAAVDAAGQPGRLS